MEETIKSPRCPICQSEHRDEFEKKLMSGEHFQNKLAIEYGFTQAQISNHKNSHMLSNLKEHLQLAIQKAVLNGLEPANITELIRLLEYTEKMQGEYYLKGREQWQTEVQEKYDVFKRMLSETNFFIPYCKVCGNVMEYSDSTYQESFIKGVLALARFCFMEQNQDTGKFVKQMLEPEDYLQEDKNETGTTKAD